MLRRLFSFLVVAAIIVVFPPLAIAAASPGNPALDVTIVDVDLATNTIRASGPDRDVAALPGSTLKPFLLLAALRMGVVTPQTRVLCTGNLRVAGRNLACTHPAGLGVLDAEEALAYSCNTYFAQLAEHMQPGSLRKALRTYGIDTAAPMQTPASRITIALGLDGVTVTPLQLAHAYAALARDLAASSMQVETVRDGLLSSVEYGMAHAAETRGVLLGGKTGTAHDSARGMQHGWFAGIVFAPGMPVRCRHVVVVYVPGGTGNDAAAAAHRYLDGRRW